MQIHIFLYVTLFTNIMPSLFFRQKRDSKRLAQCCEIINEKQDKRPESSNKSYSLFNVFYFLSS